MSSSDTDTCENNLRHKCPIKDCKAAFAKLSRLEIHTRKHTGEKPFVCDESGCSKAYTNRSHLKRHKCFVHEKISQNSQVMCGEKGCGRVFSNKYGLKKHHNQIHNESNYAFTCAECLQGFKKKRQLKRHVYLHTGEVPFECSRCNLAFKARHLYNQHMSNHRTYTCDCGVAFHVWTEFLAHRRTSCIIKKIDHECTVCNKTFKTKSNLNRHLLVHLEESEKETFRCPFIDCKRSYQYKKNLTYHIAAFHQGRNDHIKCTEPGCNQVLKTRKNLKQHLLIMHSGVPREKKPRKPRKDKGKPKKCMASYITGVKVPLQQNLLIINNTNPNRGNVSEDTPECESAIDINVVMVDKQPFDQNRTDEQSNDLFLSENVFNLSDDLNNKLNRAVAQN